MTPKQIGAAMRKARGQRSISKVAKAAGLERHQVTSIEQATKAYTMPVFLRLVKALGGWAVVFPAKGSGTFTEPEVKEIARKMNRILSFGRTEQSNKAVAAMLALYDIVLDPA